MRLLLDVGRINDIIIDCVYFPDNRVNILSTGKARKALDIAYSDVDFKIYDVHKGSRGDHPVVGYAYIYRGLPFLRHTRCTAPQVQAVFASISLFLAHRHLGHAGQPKQKVTQYMIDRVKISMIRISTVRPGS